MTEGTIPMRALLEKIDGCCPHATVTLELLKTSESVQWLMEETEWN